jgi:hypothetical protein
MVLVKPATVIQWNRKGFRLLLAVAIKIAEGEQGNQGRKNRAHADDGMVATAEISRFSPQFGVLSRDSAQGRAYCFPSSTKLGRRKLDPVPLARPYA